jgi:hypothetical protein
MPLALGPIGQIARAVADVDRAEAFYGGARRVFDDKPHLIGWTTAICG